MAVKIGVLSNQVGAMVIVGLTGSIAMGKSTVAGMFASFGVPVFDADAAVRAFYSGSGAKAVEALFPGVIGPEGVDRKRLAQRTLGDPGSLAQLEALVHPEVSKARRDFLARGRSAGWRTAVLDVPLLFESGGRAAVDVVLVVSAPGHMQRARALDRPDMTDEKLGHILARQSSDSDKRGRAHSVISTAAGLEDTRRQVRQFLRAVAAMEGGRHA